MPPPPTHCPTEELPGLPAAGRPGRSAEQQELPDRLQPTDSGGGHGRRQGRQRWRRPAGGEHEGQRPGGPGRGLAAASDRHCHHRPAHQDFLLQLNDAFPSSKI